LYKTNKELSDSDDDEEDDKDEYIKTIGTSVYFYTDVTKKNVLKLMERLEEAKNNAIESQFKKRCIYLYINSCGGDAYAGLSAMNMIKNYPCKIITIGDGFVASAATLLFLAGEKRYIVSHTQMLIHQLRTSFWGKYDELKDEMKNSTGLMESLTKIYINTTSLNEETVNDYLKKEVCFSAEECVTYGFASKIL
jgi:ATP-dependent protease ClpP protease subunit